MSSLVISPRRACHFISTDTLVVYANYFWFLGIRFFKVNVPKYSPEILARNEIRWVMSSIAEVSVNKITLWTAKLAMIGNNVSSYRVDDLKPNEWPLLL